MSVNKVILIGRLGKDPELRFTTNGDPVCSFSVATSERYKDKSGEKQEKTEWHNLVVWGKLGEVMAEHLRKGDEAFFEGKIQTRKWQDKEGVDRYTTEIVVHSFSFVGSKREGDGSQNQQTGSSAQPARQAPAPASKGSFDNFDDDIPFRDPFAKTGGLWRVA